MPVEIDGPSNRFHQLFVFAAAFGSSGVRLDLDAGLTCEEFDRFVEVETLGLFDEPENISTLAAPEAVIEAAGDVEMERRSLLLMKGTDCDVGTSLALDGGHRPHEIDQVGCAPNPIDVIPPIHRLRLPGPGKR
jgi:hypothetical protein